MYRACFTVVEWKYSGYQWAYLLCFTSIKSTPLYCPGEIFTATELNLCPLLVAFYSQATSFTPSCFNITITQMTLGLSLQSRNFL